MMMFRTSSDIYTEIQQDTVGRVLSEDSIAANNKKCSDAKIERTLTVNDRGLVNRGPRTCNISKEKLEKLLAIGFTVRQIARDGLLGGKLHFNTIHRFIKKNHLKSPRQLYSTLPDINNKPQ